MKVIIQRVKRAHVKTKDKIEGIDNGLCLLVGFETNDDTQIIEKFKNKILSLRIFGEKFEKNIRQINGEILIVPNFTIPAIIKKGTRPNFQNSLNPKDANVLFEYCIETFKKEIPTKSGVFGADMEVEIINDGPVSLIWESK